MYQLDPAQADELARKFGHQADVETTALIRDMNAGIHRMQTMIGTLTAGVKGMDWKGRRATSFDNQWESEFRPGLQRMQQSMQEFTPTLERMKLALKDAETAMHAHARDTEAIDHGR
ncbi:WXG100 family type VII secretion target [Sphaerisporangium sp. TRM90804]|uniref:WXG100 family type VII secretion target n=1 Tax=Sphaerisporangium sp. TRM90804 TaxID=3031113 RepID=UPI00244AD582|nr:WXG100 family type VII secretion target [Sphaerisporangium sp. TRM90804]MDH2426417.1 WXG100 family type VII secretion target [Sphaerisporangium sp. TRM90804]